MRSPDKNFGNCFTGSIASCGVLDSSTRFNYIEKPVFKFFFHLAPTGFRTNALKICGLPNVNKGQLERPKYYQQENLNLILNASTIWYLKNWVFLFDLSHL